MDKVKADLNHKQLVEIGEHCSSLSYIMSGAIGPDGGAAAQMASIDTLRYTGKWNSKHTEDYIQMVKDELTKQKITVTPEIEKMMIDKMIKDEIPKSSIEYIMKKAATNTIFYLPQALNKSPLENHITQQAEKRYNPSALEKGTGYALGAAADYLTMGGVGGTWTNAAKFIGVDLAVNTALDKMSESDSEDIPLIIKPEYVEQYKADQTKKSDDKPKAEDKPKHETTAVKEEQEEKVQTEMQEDTQQEGIKQEVQSVATQPEQTNSNGWSGLLSSVGLNGMTDIGHNLGYVLAMMPEFLVGMLTGKSRMMIKDNLMPLASIVAGLFVRNPILKMVLIGMGGANLINKAGHEILEDRNGQSQKMSGTNYRQYADEQLNPRIQNPELRGNCLIATIDRVPCTIALSPTVVDAYSQGALPLNTLANAVLAKNDQMKHMAQQNYRENDAQQTTSERYAEGQQNVVRPLTQR